MRGWRLLKPLPGPERAVKAATAIWSPCRTTSCAATTATAVSCAASRRRLGDQIKRLMDVQWVSERTRNHRAAQRYARTSTRRNCALYITNIEKRDSTATSHGCGAMFYNPTQIQGNRADLCSFRRLLPPRTGSHTYGWRSRHLCARRKAVCPSLPARRLVYVLSFGRRCCPGLRCWYVSPSGGCQEAMMTSSLRSRRTQPGDRS